MTTTNLPNAREIPSFEVIRGLDTTAYRVPMTIKSRTAGVDVYPELVAVGEPVRVLNGTSLDTDVAYNIDDLSFTTAGQYGHVIGVNSPSAMGLYGDNPKTWMDRVIGISFNDYSRDGSSGQPSANTLDQVTVLMGEFVARIYKTDWFVTAGSKNFVIAGAAGPTWTILDYDTTPAPGDDVVVVNYVTSNGGAGVAKFVALKTDYDDRYTTPTKAELAVDAAVVGRIVGVDGDYYTVAFKF